MVTDEKWTPREVSRSELEAMFQISLWMLARKISEETDQSWRKTLRDRLVAYHRDTGYPFPVGEKIGDPNKDDPGGLDYSTEAVLRVVEVYNSRKQKAAA
jgi:hypothetical protein